MAPTTCSAAHKCLLSSVEDNHFNLTNTETAPESPTSSHHTLDMSEVLSCDLLSSESDSYIAYTQIKGAYIQPKMTSNLSTVKHPITKHCPIITSGELTPQILLLTKNAFNEFFIVKTVFKEDEVKLILRAFKDVHIRDWIVMDHEHLLAVTFTTFMAKLCSTFLPLDWVETICISLLGMRMSRNMKFWDYAQEVHAQNIVLHGMPSHLIDSALQNQLETGLRSSLRCYNFKQCI
jgi:hypothetical protein